MTTIVNGATKARLVWILSQIANLQNWIQPDGQTILSGVQIELQDIVNGATEPAIVAPTTEIQAMTVDQVAAVVAQVKEDMGAQIALQNAALCNFIGDVRDEVIAHIPAAPTPAATTTAPAAADPATAATATA